jgi:tetratricopeptide (TPR) repeat protein
MNHPPVFHTRRRLLAAAGILFSLASVEAHADTPALDLYREAQLQENTSRNPEAAAKLYTEFLQQPGIDRAAQADAYLHLGFCQARLGRREDAKTQWRKVVQEFSDQPEVYSRALSELQAMQIAEQSKAELRQSSPTIKVVYEPVPTRWNFDFIHIPILHTADGKGNVIESQTVGFVPNFDYFIKPGRLAIGFSGGLLGGNYNYSNSVLILNPHIRLERQVLGVFFPYLNVGPSIYRFHYVGVPAQAVPIQDPIFGGTYNSYEFGTPQESTRWTAGWRANSVLRLVGRAASRSRWATPYKAFPK